MQTREMLLRQIRRAEEELARLDSLPDLSEVPEDTVLMFSKRFTGGGRVYRYAAIKHAGRWYLTSTRPNVTGGFNDVEMIEWIIEGWPTHQPLDIWYATAWESVE